MSGTDAITRASVTRELARLGVIADGDAPAPEAVDGRPWFVALLLGAAGWLAGLFAMFFVWMLFEPDTTGAMVVIGVALLTGAFALYVIERANPFFAQLALAFSIAGQISLVVAAIGETDSAAATSGLAALMQLVLLYALPNRFAKALAAFFFCIAWALTLRFAWWGEPELAGGIVVVVPLPALVGWVVVWAPIAVAVEVAIASEARWMATRARTIVRPALAGLLVGLSFAPWVSEPLATLRFWFRDEAYANWLAVWPLLAAAAALFAVVAAFRLRERALVGVGIVGAGLHVLQFYYVLGVSLLAKSVMMVAVGAALLVAARLLEGRTSLASGRPS